MNAYWKALVIVVPFSAVLAAACDDDVTTFAPSTASSTTAAAGGWGGDGTTTSANGGATNTTTSAGGSPGTGGMGFGGGNTCDQACNYIENGCGFTGACASAGIDCNDPNAECPAQCFLAATCQQIATLATNNPDPMLSACLQNCQGMTDMCGQCVGAACQSEIAACQNDQTCGAYVQCVQMCQTPQCEQTCLQNNNSQASQDLSTCICSSCSMECPVC